jgi:hypothetical protein
MEFEIAGVDPEYCLARRGIVTSAYEVAGDLAGSKILTSTGLVYGK